MRRAALLSLVLLLVACPSAPPTLGDCPDGSTVTWATVQPIFETNCTRCHASTLAGAMRQAAPEGWDYDSAAAALRDPDETWDQIYLDRMPNDAAFTPTADKRRIWEWYSCGGPE